MSDFEAKREFSHSPSLAAHLTAVRGKVRRLPEGVEKQRLELLAALIENGAPAIVIARQVEIMSGK
jgi:hypothetical protein